MSAIRLLPASVAERIAAGEVIDRPAAVVKELLENAADAGARSIRVDAQGGGLRLIRVADDGAGIPTDEVELAFRRHATSKLRLLDDLERLQTFGFRGEALASIAAVADVTVLTSTGEAPAVSASFRGGHILERVSAARSRGTTITVRDLFSTMPARLKFLRGARSEAAEIGAVVRRFALAQPNLRLTLALEGHIAFRCDGGRELLDSLAAVYSAESGAFLPVEEIEAAGARLRGAVADRSLTRANRSQVSLFVNGRYVRCRALLAAIEAGYRGVLPKGRHAVAALFVDVPPADLDVNIHPAKLDVRLRHEAAIAAALSEAVRRAYGRYAARLQPKLDLALAGRQERLPVGVRMVREEQPSWSWGEESHGAGSLPPLRLLGQVYDALIVAELDDGLLFIDQHRAHERVIYERLVAASPRPQALIEPALLDLAPAQATRLAERLPALETLGIVCEEFGSSRFVVRSLPAGAELDALAGVLPELLREAAEDGEAWRERLLASLACRAAVRKGRRLARTEALDLVERLGATRSPAVCPHGSPVLLQLAGSALQRGFNWS